jgi:hypothetical protein
LDAVIGVLAALVLFPLWACGDALIRPRAAWKTAGHRQAVWVLATGPPTVGAVALATVGWFRAIVLGADAAAYMYMVKVRPMVRLAQGLHRENRNGPDE